MKCRFCDTKLEQVFIDLGEMPPSNSYLTSEQLGKAEPKYPLKLFVCSNCFLVQVDEYKKASEIFSAEYAYFSSYSRTWLEHARKYVGKMIPQLELDTNSQVIEIASNDGYLLQYFLKKNIPVLGIEPTANTAEVAEKKGVSTLVEFFGEKLANDLAAQNKKADLILGNNVLAHVPNINDFVKGLKTALKEQGTITMEFPHLLQLIEHNQFDTIYHEHFSYLSLITVEQIFKAQGLTVYDVEELPTHGGSLRIYAKHTANQSLPVSQRITDLLAKEKDKGLSDLNYYSDFQQKAEKVRTDLLTLLPNEKKKKKKIAAYGAAAKGNTLLNFCNINSSLIDMVADASPHKQGKLLPGSHIPIVSEKELKEHRPDLVLILPWNLKDEIMEQLSYIRDWGGKFIIPIPELSVV